MHLPQHRLASASCCTQGTSSQTTIFAIALLQCRMYRRVKKNPFVSQRFLRLMSAWAGPRMAMSGPGKDYVGPRTFCSPGIPVSARNLQTLYLIVIVWYTGLRNTEDDAYLQTAVVLSSKPGVIPGPKIIKCSYLQENKMTMKEGWEPEVSCKHLLRHPHYSQAKQIKANYTARFSIILQRNKNQMLFVCDSVSYFGVRPMISYA